MKSSDRWDRWDDEDDGHPYGVFIGLRNAAALYLFVALIVLGIYSW